MSLGFSPLLEEKRTGVPERQEVARALQSGGLVVPSQVQKLSLGTLNAGKLRPFNLGFGWTQASRSSMLTQILTRVGH